MVIVRLKGGLGNQMFQYAFGLKMASSLNTELSLDLSTLLDRARGKDIVYRNYDLDIFNVDARFIIPPVILQALYKIRHPGIGKLIRSGISSTKNYVREPHFHVAEEILRHPQDETIYEGWWQSDRYFKGVEEKVRKAFSFKESLLPRSGILFEQMEQTNSVCLNVRRTDFLKVPALNTTNSDYFHNAAREMASRVTDPHFFVFSDDLEWCQKNLRLDHPVSFVGHEFKGYKFGNYLRLMSNCKHFIIPNSSFAWWAVWLNQHPSRVVIAPKNWFNNKEYITSDLVPPQWLRM